MKQILADNTGPAMSHEEMIDGHHVEIMVSSRWLVGYLVMHMVPKHGVGKDKLAESASLLEAFLKSVSASVTTALATSPADLPRCSMGNIDGQGACRHVREVVAKMYVLYGQSWKQHQVHHFLAETCLHPTCPSLQHWRQLVLQECCTACDAAVGLGGQALSSCVGASVLVSPNKARRLTSVTRSTPGITIASGQQGCVFSDGGDRTDAVAFAEKAQLSMYLEHGAEAFENVVQNYMTVDCSSVSGRELLTLGFGTPACALDKAEYAMWLPCQDMLSSVVPFSSFSMSCQVVREVPKQCCTNGVLEMQEHAGFLQELLQLSLQDANPAMQENAGNWHFYAGKAILCRKMQDFGGFCRIVAGFCRKKCRKMQGRKSCNARIWVSCIFMQCKTLAYNIRNRNSRS